MDDSPLRPRRCLPETTPAAAQPSSPGTVHQHVDYLPQTRAMSAFQVWKALARRPHPRSIPIFKSLNASSCTTPTIREASLFATEPSNHQEHCPSPFNFVTSQLVLERIMSQSDVSPLTSGRLSHSSGTLNISGSATSSPPLSPSEELEDDDLVKVSFSFFFFTADVGARTVGRWLKDRREKKKEEARVHNAQLHAAVSVASVAAAVAAITAATPAASSSMLSGRNNEEMVKMDMAVASAATLVAAQCVEAAEAMGAEREHLASVVSSAVNVRTHDDVTTLTAAAATALRGAATLKARATKDVWNIAAVAPADRSSIGIGLCSKATTANSYSGNSGEILTGECVLGGRIPEFLANGAELLKRTRKGDLHWKIVSVYINKAGHVILKMKSKHVAGTVTKKDKNVVIDVCKDIPAWPGRHLLEDGDERRYFGLKTVTRGVVEFECKNRREYDIWTYGVSRLLTMAAAGKRRMMPSLVRDAD
ncbi:hypothetical protein MLD38_016023 [Melastoma candidum]|uniref:Uncharacterized protein n=1 Tax=Melastoma candidum TaxID=119954 RepID=A0ACB9RI78_9MYRT|nr:hypothetical protein MLD38_016023 [Melastoma candidum]